MDTPRTPYSTDVTDDEWAFVAPYLTLMDEDAPQRRHDLREVFNALRWIVWAGAPWRLLPHEFPPWPAVSQQIQRWIAAGCFDAIVHDLRAMLRVADGREPQPTAVILDGKTLPSSPESGHRTGDDGHKRKQGSTLHAAVDTLGHLLVAHLTPAHEQARAPVDALVHEVQDVTGQTVEVAFVDQGDTGDEPAQDAAAPGVELAVVSLPAAERGFVLLPRRWVIERSFAWAAKPCRLAKVDERLPEIVVGLHVVALTCLMLHGAVVALPGSP